MKTKNFNKINKLSRLMKRKFKMGCSSSMTRAAFFNRNQFDCNVFHETTTALKFSTGEENNNLLHSNSNSETSENVTEQNKTNEIQINQAHILIVSRESSITSAASSDYIPYKTRQRTDSMMNGARIWTSKQDSIEPSSDGGRVIKSALKPEPTEDNGHVIVNRPVKSVTFLDAVTVVTVY